MLILQLFKLSSHTPATAATGDVPLAPPFGPHYIAPASHRVASRVASLWEQNDAPIVLYSKANVDASPTPAWGRNHVSFLLKFSSKGNVLKNHIILLTLITNKSASTYDFTPEETNLKKFYLMNYLSRSIEKFMKILNISNWHFNSITYRDVVV